MPVATANEIGRRRQTLDGATDVAELAGRLARLAADVVQRPLYIPSQKALLSKDGGVCPHDGSRLTFDPFSPDRHECPACGAVQEGERHHRAWIWRYHIWLTERAIHLALLDSLGAAVGGGAGRAREIVVSYARRYRDYPNIDNVLGPTRLFFSTYLESIWLIQLVITASLLEWRDEDAGLDDLRAVVEESAALIGSFDEGWSNRQVWNSTALIAAGRWLGDETLLERGLEGPHGITALLMSAVSEDGRWHEGENYHFFALRGFLLAAELLRPAGIDVYHEDPWKQRMRNMYAAPLVSVMPDLSIPARGDSPFGVTLLQERFAELWEIGWSRTGDPRLAGVLAAMYQADLPTGEEHGLAEIAEVEQNRQPQRPSRTRLGWKALLWMREEAPSGNTDAWHAGSVLVEPAGPAILRPTANRYVALECAGTGGGHGHPDQLHLTVYWDHAWLMDFGTGSYVAESLHWYRSTLAHNAAGLSGAGQVGGRGWCTAFDENGEWGWCRGVSQGSLGPQTCVTRTVVAGPDYVVDTVEISAPERCVVDLPFHFLGKLQVSDLSTDEMSAESRQVLGAEAGHESGYDAVDEVHVFTVPPERVRCVAGLRELDVLLAPRPNESCLLMRAPGPPSLALADTERREFLVRRSAGSGKWVQVYAPTSIGLARVTIDANDIVIERDDGRVDTVTLADDGVRIVDGSRRVTRLRGILQPLPPASPSSSREPRPPGVRCQLLDQVPGLDGYFDAVAPDTVVSLGRTHYRRSESDYPGEDAFTARVAISAHAHRLYVGVEVRKPRVLFRAADAHDPQLDNETPDIHSDGVQFYVDRGGWCGFVAIPEEGGERVRVRPVAGTMAVAGQLTGTWRRTADGYVMLLQFDARAAFIAGEQVLVQVVVNEMQPGRWRRAGQLALVGGGGWIYLRGDRESPAAAAMAEVR